MAALPFSKAQQFHQLLWLALHELRTDLFISKQSIICMEKLSRLEKIYVWIQPGKFSHRSSKRESMGLFLNNIFLFETLIEGVSQEHPRKVA